MQDDQTDTLIENLNQVKVGRVQKEDGEFQENHTSTCDRLIRQYQIDEGSSREARPFSRSQEEEKRQGDGIVISSGNDILSQEDRSTPSRPGNGCEGQEENDGKDWTGIRWEDCRRDKDASHWKKDKIDFADCTQFYFDMPFVSENFYAAVCETPGNGDDKIWPPCINKNCIAKILGKCCLPKQLTQDLEDERKILKRMERIECSLSKISNRIDKLSQSGYVCQKHSPSKFSTSDDSTKSEERQNSNGGTQSLENSTDSTLQECPTGQSCVGRMVSFNSSLIRSVDSDFYDDSDYLYDTCDSSEAICCSSSFCQGLAKGLDGGRTSSGPLERQTFGQRNKSSLYKGISIIGKDSSWTEESSVCNGKHPSSAKESSASIKESSSAGKSFISLRKKSSHSCKDASSFGKVSPVSDKELLPVSKENTFCKKEISCGKTLSFSKREPSSHTKERVTSAESQSDCKSSQRQIGSASTYCDEFSDTTDETEQSCEDMQRECSQNSQPTTLNCKISSEKESEFLEQVEETLREGRVLYSDDYEPYLIKKPDAIPRSMQRRLAKIQAEQGCRS